MRKWTALLTVLVLLCAAAGAFAGTAAEPDLYDLYEVTEDGRTWIGTAIPIVEGVTVTSAAGISMEMDQVEIWDGKAYRDVGMMLSTAQGTVLVLLHETDGEEAGIPEYPFLETYRMPTAGELFVRSGDWMKSRINRAVYDCSVTTWKGREAMLLTLSGETAAGSAVLTSDGKLAGVIVSEYAEGLNRYIALTISGIRDCLQEANTLMNISEGGNAPEGYNVTVDRNIVTFDWSGMELPVPGEGEKLYHIVADTESSFLSYAEIRAKDETKLSMLLTPGRTYVSGVAVFAGTPDDLPSQVAVTALPEAEPQTDHGYQSVTLAIGEVPPGAAQDTVPDLPEEITETLLRSGRACIYSVSTYQVDQEIKDCTLLVTLTAPDGNNYRYESSWYYLPDYNARDAWFVTMDESGLLDMLNQNGYPEGTYEVSMYIDGKLADSFSFKLIK